MPFLIQGPGIKGGSVSNDIISNVDFAPTWLQMAGIRIPNFMQGDPFLGILMGAERRPDDAVAYHRYWMHRDVMHNAYV